MRRKIRLRYRAAYLRLCLACILSAPIMRAGWWWNIKRRSNFGLNCVHSGRRGVFETDWKISRARLDQGILRNTLSKVDRLGGAYMASEKHQFRTRLLAKA